MKKSTNKLLLLFLCTSLFWSCSDDEDQLPTYKVIGFSEPAFSLSPESAWYGQDESGEEEEEGIFTSTFTSGAAVFENEYNSNWQSWKGWGYSNMTDQETAGVGNIMSSYAGSDASGSGVFAVGFGRFLFDFESPVEVMEVSITNSTYAAMSMRDGDQFAKKFGGSTGDDPDYFMLTIEGIDEDGELTGSINVYLADYTFSDNSKDFILDKWEKVNLTSLGVVKSLDFILTSTDVGDWGMNTPSVFCLDNLKYE